MRALVGLARGGGHYGGSIEEGGPAGGCRHEVTLRVQWKTLEYLEQFPASIPSRESYVARGSLAEDEVITNPTFSGKKTMTGHFWRMQKNLTHY